MRLLTLARDLRRRKARERTSCFVAEGVRTVEELLRSGLAVRGVLVAPQLLQTERGAALRAALEARGLEVAEVSERDFTSAAETDSPQGVLAIADAPARSWDAVRADRPAVILALDAIQDPGNVGTMVRTAAALGTAATVALPGTVDLWNAKVVRSAMGAHFTYPAFSTDWPGFDDWRSASKVVLWGAEAHGQPISEARGGAPPRLALAVGNEGGGLSKEVRERSGQMVGLPIAGVESLNVAVAAAILLYELVPTSRRWPDRTALA